MNDETWGPCADDDSPCKETCFVCDSWRLCIQTSKGRKVNLLLEEDRGDWQTENDDLEGLVLG